MRTVLDIVSQLGGGSVVDSVRDPLLEVSRSQGAGAAFVIRLLGALWSASGYVGAFGRAMNRVYEVGEGARSGSCGPSCCSSPWSWWC